MYSKTNILLLAQQALGKILSNVNKEGLGGFCFALSFSFLLCFWFSKFKCKKMLIHSSELHSVLEFGEWIILRSQLDSCWEEGK